MHRSAGRTETKRQNGTSVGSLPAGWKLLLRHRREYESACKRLERALEDYSKGRMAEGTCRRIVRAAERAAADYEARLRRLVR